MSDTIIIIIFFISLFFTANFTGYSRLLGEETSRNHQAYKERAPRMYYMQYPRSPTQKNGPQFFASNPSSYIQVIRYRRSVIC